MQIARDSQSWVVGCGFSNQADYAERVTKNAILIMHSIAVAQ